MKKEEYLEILNPIIKEYEKFSYEFWEQHLNSVISFEVHSKNNQDCQIEINSCWDDKPNETIRINFSIDNGGFRAYFPVTESIIKMRNEKDLTNGSN